MCYSIELIRKEEQKTTNWSGGTTTELAIYPKDAIYSQCNFKWRLSSATVEDERSTFTSLKGIWRLIMILEGEMTLEHEGKYTVHLKPFEQDSFSGEWVTNSTGKVKDFNLMMASGCEGSISAIELRKDKFVQIEEELSKSSDEGKRLTEVFYCVNGNALVNIDEREIKLNEGDVLLINVQNNLDSIDVKINCSVEQGADIVRASILY